MKTAILVLVLIAIVLTVAIISLKKQLDLLKKTTPRMSKNELGETILKDENNKTIYIN